MLATSEIDTGLSPVPASWSTGSRQLFLEPEDGERDIAKSSNKLQWGNKPERIFFLYFTCKNINNMYLLVTIGNVSYRSVTRTQKIKK